MCVFGSHVKVRKGHSSKTKPYKILVDNISCS